MPDYLLSLQIFAAIYTMTATGYGCAAFKVFQNFDATAVHKILNYVCVPGLVFYEIAKQPFNFTLFKPLIISILTQVFLQVVLVIICLVFPFKSKFKQFINFSLSCSYSDFLFSGYCIANFLFDKQYVFIPIMLSVVQFFILLPIHRLIMFLVLGAPTSQIEEISQDEPKKNDNQVQENQPKTVNSNDGELDDIESHCTKIKVDGTDNIATLTSKTEMKGISKTSSNYSKFKEEVDHELITDKNNDPLTNNGDDTEVPKRCPWFYSLINRFKIVNIKTTIFFSLVTPINISFVFSIVWSAIGWTMPNFLDQFLLNLKKAVVSGGLFATGVLMWKHPFFGCNPFEMIAALFCFLLKLDATMTKVIIFCMCSPSTILSYTEAIRNNLCDSIITYTFFWTNLLSIAVFMLWTVVFNQTTFFSS